MNIESYQQVMAKQRNEHLLLRLFPLHSVCTDSSDSSARAAEEED